MKSLFSEIQAEIEDPQESRDDPDENARSLVRVPPPKASKVDQDELSDTKNDIDKQ